MNNVQRSGSSPPAMYVDAVSSTRAGMSFGS
jgi:hypothetical protein